MHPHRRPIRGASPAWPPAGAAEGATGHNRQPPPTVLRPRMFSLIRLTVRRARQERLPQVAGSLTFTTLLAAVPLVAVGFALFTHFPAFERFAAALERYLLASLLPPDLARTVLAHLHRFAANAAELTWLGSLFLLGTALAMLLTIENALNQIWAVRRPRPWLRRIGLYLLVLLAAPPLLGVVLWASSYLLGVSMGWLGPLPPGARFVLDLGPALISCVGLAALFRYVPNTRVRWRDALLGALLASVVLELGKRGFAAYLLKLPTYRAVYGAFAVIPLFLLWAYFSWLVTLGAALITANLPRQG